MNNRRTALVLGYSKNKPVAYLWRGDYVEALGPTRGWIYPLGIDDSHRVLGFTRVAEGKTLGLRWEIGQGWQELGLPPGWLPASTSPRGVIVGRVELDGWTRPWICTPPSQPVLLPHYAYHHTNVAHALDSLTAAGSASTDHGSHAVIWRPVPSAAI